LARHCNAAYTHATSGKHHTSGALAGVTRHDNRPKARVAGERSLNQVETIHNARHSHVCHNQIDAVRVCETLNAASPPVAKITS
jgi:stage V sporulation protein SpoVS